MKSKPDGPGRERDWDRRYREGDTPWDSGLPSKELIRVLDEVPIKPCLAIELGCGTGTNAVELARRGFTVTAVDCSPTALAMAKQKASADVSIDFVEADVCELPEPKAAFDFVFDRGCYHCVRRGDLAGFVESLRRITRPGTKYLMFAGNANEESEDGIPRVYEHEIRAELEALFSFERVRAFRIEDRGGVEGPLGWSCLMIRS